MNLNDVFRNLTSQISIHTGRNFDNVSDSPGVYAWFYPLKIRTKSIEIFLSEIHNVMMFDSKTMGVGKREVMVNWVWESLLINVTKKPSDKIISETVKNQWDALCEDPEKFDEVRRLVLASSLFGQPLYVGKASNLRIRCAQHINGTGALGNDFHSRFENYATEMNLGTRKVSDLIFACVKTEINEITLDDNDYKSIIEELLHRVCKPPFSER